LKKKDLKSKKLFSCVYSPEREDPDNTKVTTKTTPEIVGGITASYRKVGKALYEQIIEQVIEVFSTHITELTKLLENIYRCVNITLITK